MFKFKKPCYDLKRLLWKLKQNSFKSLLWNADLQFWALFPRTVVFVLKKTKIIHTLFVIALP